MEPGGRETRSANDDNAGEAWPLMTSFSPRKALAIVLTATATIYVTAVMVTGSWFASGSLRDSQATNRPHREEVGGHTGKSRLAMRPGSEAIR